MKIMMIFPTMFNLIFSQNFISLFWGLFNDKTNLKGREGRLKILEGKLCHSSLGVLMWDWAFISTVSHWPKTACNQRRLPDVITTWPHVKWEIMFCNLPPCQRKRRVWCYTCRFCAWTFHKKKRPPARL